MANVPAWNDNALACYPYVLERLREVSQVKRVLEAADFAAISGAQRKQVPLDGAVYLILDGYTPTSSNGKGREQLIEIFLSHLSGDEVILSKNRNGKTGVVRLAFEGHMGRFSNDMPYHSGFNDIPNYGEQQ